MSAERSEHMKWANRERQCVFISAPFKPDQDVPRIGERSHHKSPGGRRPLSTRELYRPSPRHNNPAIINRSVAASFHQKPTLCYWASRRNSGAEDIVRADCSAVC
jgi:hypothetical protein